jgi:hypothetical protein
MNSKQGMAVKTMKLRQVRKRREKITEAKSNGGRMQPTSRWVGLESIPVKCNCSFSSSWSTPYDYSVRFEIRGNDIVYRQATGWMKKVAGSSL